MNRHVLRNLFTKRSAINNASMSTFPDILQAAAGRAWARCLTTSARRVKDGKSESIISNLREVVDDAWERNNEASSSASTSWRVSKDEGTEPHASAPLEPSVRPQTVYLHTGESDRVLDSAKSNINAAVPSNIPCSSPSCGIQDPRSQHNNAPREGRRQKAWTPRRGVVILTDASSLSDHDIESTIPGPVLPYYIDDPPWNDAAMVSSASLVTRRTPPLPIPTTPASLYQNLLHLLSYHPVSPPPLPDLLDYHASFPRDLSLRSTRSYNLLAGLAIRHAAYLSAEQIFSDMRAENVQGDLETWKLCVRWLIRTGGWGVAWKEVMQAIGRQDWKLLGRNSGRRWSDMPLPIWLEFFASEKRRGFRKYMSTRNWIRNGRGGITRKAVFEVLREAGDRVAADSSRYGILMGNLPTLTRNELQRMPPRTMNLMVHMMLRTGQKDLALKATKSYLNGLPPKVDDNWAQACLNLIHLYIIFPSAKRGLSAFHKTRKTTNSLLAVHPKLRPNSTTVFLLLRSLYSTQRCGTIARNFVRDFKRRWGAATEDRRVRRRIASLALKEGRTDIAEAVVKADNYSRWSRMMLRFEGEVLGGGHRPPTHRKLLRARDRKVYGKKGQEGWRWKRLRWKLKSREQTKRRSLPYV